MKPPDTRLNYDQLQTGVAAANRHFVLIGSSDGYQSLTLTGLRFCWGSQEMPWNGSRFRKGKTLAKNAPKKRRRKQPSSKLVAIH
jgi:hypothetical protein